jgi:hypothetical protein
MQNSNFIFGNSTYDLFALFNMGRFRLDRVCTKHVVYYYSDALDKTFRLVIIVEISIIVVIGLWILELRVSGDIPVDHQRSHHQRKHQHWPRLPTSLTNTSLHFHRRRNVELL